MASDGTLAPATSTPFNIVTPALTSFSVTPSTNNPTAGTAFNVTITALDQSGFTFPGTTGAQTIAFSGPANSPNGHAPTYPGTVSFTNGVGTASVALFDAQTTTLAAIQGAVSGTWGSLTVSGATTLTGLAVANPGNQTAGTAFNVTITATDPYGNADPAFSGSKTVSFSGPGQHAQRAHADLPGNGDLHQRRRHGLSHPLRRPDDDADSDPRVLSAARPPASPWVPAPPQSSRCPRRRPRRRARRSTDARGVRHLRERGHQLRRPARRDVLGPSNSPNGIAPTYPASVTFTNGVGPASVALFDSAEPDLTATQGAASGTSGTFTVNGTGTVSTFNVSAPGTATVGTAFNVTITAADPYGNGTDGYSGAKAISFSGPSNSPNGHTPTYPGR